MNNVEVVEKFGANGFIDVKEAIFDCKGMKFESVRGKKYYHDGETEFYTLDVSGFNALVFTETVYDKHHHDKVYISSDITSVSECIERTCIPFESTTVFITKNQDINKIVNEDGNMSYYHVDIEGRFKKPLLGYDDTKKLYVNATFFRTNFPIVRIYEIEEGIEIDLNMIYFEPETILIASDNNIIIKSEAHSEIFKKIFDSRAYGGYTETYKHKVLTEFAPQTNIVKDIDIYRAK